MKNKLQILLAKREEAFKAMSDFNDGFDEDHDMTEDERKKFEALKTAVDNLDKKIKDQEDIEAREIESPTIDTGDETISPIVSTGPDPREGTGGFASLGEFTKAVHAAGVKGQGHYVDKRLQPNAQGPGTFGSERSGADGGYLIPPEFSNSIKEHMLDDINFLSMTDNMTVDGNSMAFPTDETTAWGDDGINVYWEAEGARGKETKGVLGRKELRLNKLFAIMPVTDELLEDSSTLSSWLTRKAGEALRWETNDSLINGSGAGQPMGIANASALVTVAKKSGQTADTLVVDNVSDMYSRALRPMRSVWVCNSDVLPQLIQLNVANQPVWVAPGSGMQTAPGGMLMGRPIYFSESCKTLGDNGDIYLVDWMAYCTITKRSGIKTDMSMHLWFDYDMMAFRVIFRLDGQPWLKKPVERPNSTLTKSPFVTLAERA